MIKYRIRVNGKRWVGQDFNTEQEAVFRAQLFAEQPKIEIVKCDIQIIEAKEIKV
jgi:hypothetical protein